MTSIFRTNIENMTYYDIQHCNCHSKSLSMTNIFRTIIENRVIMIGRVTTVIIS